MIDFSRRCAGAPFNNQSRTRGVGVPLCSGPSSLVLVQGTEVRILPGLPLNSLDWAIKQIRISVLNNEAIGGDSEITEIIFSS